MAVLKRAPLDRQTVLDKAYRTVGETVVMLAGVSGYDFEVHIDMIQVPGGHADVVVNRDDVYKASCKRLLAWWNSDGSRQAWASSAPASTKPAEGERNAASAPAQPATQGADLTEMVRQSDRVIVVERDDGDALMEVEAIKGPTGCGADAFLATVKATFAGRPSREKSWLLFLREDSDERALPKLAPQRETDWFMPATDRLIEQVRAAVVPTGSRWSGGYAPHSDPPELTKAVWARRAQFDVGQDIVVEVAVKNSGKTAITIPQFRYNIYDYCPAMKFYVTLPDGRRVILAKPKGAMREEDAPSQRTLQPGGVYVHAFRLNRWPLASLPGYEQELDRDEKVFSQSGDYVIVASYDRVRASYSEAFRLIGKPTTQPEASREVKDGDMLTVGGRRYVVQCLGGKPGLPTFDLVQDRAKWFVWHNGDGWVIDPLKPDLRSAFKCRWPVQAVSPDISLAVVSLPEERRRPDDPVVMAIVDLKNGQILGRLPEPVEKWGFSSDGRFVWPLQGVASSAWFYFDVRQKKAVSRPLMDVKPDTWQHWSGAVLPDGKTVVMSTRVYEKEHRVVRFDPDKPDVVEPVKGMTDATVISGRFGDEILCCTFAGASSLVSTKTWESRKLGEDEVRLLEGRRDATGKLIYYRDPQKELTIRDLKTGKDTSFYFRDGWFFNAATLGVTFSSDGKLAVVATPYDFQLTFIDNGTRKVIRRARLFAAPAGAFLIEPEDGTKPGTCLVVGTYLPHE
jgi:hypothetical protein